MQGEMRNINFWPENLKGRYNIEDWGVDGRIILEHILQKMEVLNWIRLPPQGGSLADQWLR